MFKPEFMFHVEARVQRKHLREFSWRERAFNDPHLSNAFGMMQHENNE